MQPTIHRGLVNQAPQTAGRIEISSAFELATLFANLAQSEHFSIGGGIKLENE